MNICALECFIDRSRHVYRDFFQLHDIVYIRCVLKRSRAL